ncbi:uncharacterized protein LOC141534628 [Cotesia typhae]|uniref:uncharacterized protein LOC141534628 n=1 Tax=Cotesia typhae TaxID=2053667 RepID=UPI003D6858EE
MIPRSLQELQLLLKSIIDDDGDELEIFDVAPEELDIPEKKEATDNYNDILCDIENIIPPQSSNPFLAKRQPVNTKPAKKKDVISNKENLMKKIKLNLPLTKDVLKIPLKPAETIVEVHQPPSSFVTNTKPAEKKDVISNGGLKISTALALSSKAASQTVKLQLPRSYCENEEIFINGKKSKIIAIRKVNDINFSEILLKQKIDKFYPEFATKSVKFPKLEDPEKTKNDHDQHHVSFFRNNLPSFKRKFNFFGRADKWLPEQKKKKKIC